MYTITIPSFLMYLDNLYTYKVYISLYYSTISSFEFEFFCIISNLS